MRRTPSPHASRSMSDVSSVTQAPSRTDSSISMACSQSSSWARSSASLTLSSMGNPIETRRHRVAQASTNAWVAPAESARTRIGWTTAPGGSPSSMTEPPLLRQLGDGRVEDGDVVGRVVGPGVARPQQTGQCLLGLVEKDEDRMVPIAALVVRGGFFLVGVRGEQRRVDVQGDGLRRHARRPRRAGPRGGPTRSPRRPTPTTRLAMRWGARPPRRTARAGCEAPADPTGSHRRRRASPPGG